jgi:hypothetical protein
LFWEVREDRPTSGVILQVLTEDLDAGQVLAKAVFPTERGLSVVRNRYAPYWGSADMMIQTLRALHEYGWDHVRSRILPEVPYKGKKQIYRRPGNAELIRWLAPAVAAKAARRLSRALSPAQDFEWRVGLRENASLLENGSSADLKTFRWLPSPEDGYLADPFLLQQNGRLWLFAEQYRYRDKKAVLCVCEVRSGLVTTEWQVCLDKPYHMSYPHVFEHAGEIFMVPETGKAGEVQLYRARDFPVSWHLEQVLFRGNAVDTTVWFQDGLWWFFVTLIESRGRGLTLLLFYAETLTGEWKWHPANPLSRDVRNARSAGAVFRYGDRLFRPSQDNGIRYGCSFSLNEIFRLNKHEYQERPAVTVLANSMPDITGTHTYSRCGNVEAVDAEFRIPVRRKA